MEQCKDHAYIHVVSHCACPMNDHANCENVSGPHVIPISLNCGAYSQSSLEIVMHSDLQQRVTVDSHLIRDDIFDYKLHRSRFWNTLMTKANSILEQSSKSVSICLDTIHLNSKRVFKFISLKKKQGLERHRKEEQATGTRVGADSLGPRRKRGVRSWGIDWLGCLKEVRNMKVYG